MAKRTNKPRSRRTSKNLEHSKIVAELADRKLAATTQLPFSVEDILQKLTACATEAEQEAIWQYLDGVVPTLDRAQLARFRVEFADSLKESSRRVEQALSNIESTPGARA